MHFKGTIFLFLSYVCSKTDFLKAQQNLGGAKNLGDLPRMLPPGYGLAKGAAVKSNTMQWRSKLKIK